MPERFPGYDVLAKRLTASWDHPTRQAIEARLAVPDEPRFLDLSQWATLKGLCEGVLPQPSEAECGRAAAPLAAYIDRKLLLDARDGFRHAELPVLRECWTRGLDALEAEAQFAHGLPLAALAPELRDALIERLAKGQLACDAWAGMPSRAFFWERAAPDIVGAYYAHPNAWSEIGFGGPASPRGYVRLDFDRRDPWEASEARPGRQARARRENGRVGRS